jgi:thioredoxin family protein
MRLRVIGLWCFAWSCCLTAGLAPLTIKEVSLMLRSGYSSEAVLQELSKRKFADTLDPTSEEQLVTAGASQSLINTLESGVYQLSAAETAAAAEKQKSNAEKVSRTNLEPQTASQSAPTKPVSPTEAQVGGNLYDHFKDDLVYWHEGSLVPFDDETLQKKKFYLLFFSAIWSKEGRQFTSRLVDYYNRVAPQHPEFEIVFFSADRSAFAMENYISQTNMPWPVIAFDKRSGKAGGIQSLVREIPHLILADSTGKILSDSGNDQPNLDKVMIDLEKVLAGN